MGGEGSMPCLCRFTSGKEVRYPLYRRWECTHHRSGLLRKKSCPQWMSHPGSSLYTEWHGSLLTLYSLWYGLLHHSVYTQTYFEISVLVSLCVVVELYRHLERNCSLHLQGIRMISAAYSTLQTGAACPFDKF